MITQENRLIQSHRQTQTEVVKEAFVKYTRKNGTFSPQRITGKRQNLSLIENGKSIFKFWL